MVYPQLWDDFFTAVENVLHECEDSSSQLWVTNE